MLINNTFSCHGNRFHITVTLISNAFHTQEVTLLIPFGKRAYFSTVSATGYVIIMVKRRRMIVYKPSLFGFKKPHKLRKTFGKFFRSYSELLSKFGDILFQEYVFKGISHPVFYGDLVYKLRRVKDTPNFISSGSKIVKRLRRRQYAPLIIETTIGLVLGPCTALCRLFLKHCTLTNKAVGTI